MRIEHLSGIRDEVGGGQGEPVGMPVRIGGSQAGIGRSLGAAREGHRLGPEKTVKVGEETVLYRHEKTFVNRTVFAVNINDTDDPKSIDATLKAVRDYLLVRVGEELRVEMVSVTQKGSDADAFVKLATKAWETTKRPLVLRSADVKSLTSAAAAVKGSRSLLCAATPDAANTLWPVAKENEHALAVTAPDLDSLVTLTAEIKKAGFNDLVLHFTTHSAAEQFQTNSIARRAAIKDAYNAGICFHSVHRKRQCRGEHRGGNH
jgi:acetyl-CoA decarbonylase/synthase complex subunit gamma